MAKYRVEFEIHVCGGVIVDAETKAEAQKFVRNQVCFSFGELEDEDTFYDNERTSVTAMKEVST